MKANEPAFPNMNYEGVQMGGLTKRELFAAMAMQGLSSISPVMVMDLTTIAHPEWIAREAVNYADALIAELEKSNAP